MVRISVSHALPARARRLTRDDMDRVFGGCADENVGCGKDSDCCPSWWDGGVIRCNDGTCKMYSKVR